MMAAAPSSSAARGCPICRKPTDPAFKPFCSKRCADVDLSRWLKGVYVVPGETVSEEDTPESPGKDEG